MDPSRWMPFLLFLLIVSGAYYLYYTPDYERFFNRGVKFYQNNDTEAAATEFLKAISEAEEATDPSSEIFLLDSYLLAGEIFDIHQNNPKQSIKMYEKAAKTFPHYKKAQIAHLRAAETYIHKMGEQKKAITIFKSVLKQNLPNMPLFDVKIKLLKAYLDIYEFKQAEVEAKSFITNATKNEDYSAIRFIYADALAYQEKWKKAIISYEAVWQNNPESYYANLARFEKGNCLVKTGKFKEALQVFENALQFYPNPDVVRLRIADTKQRIGKLDKGKKKEEWELPKPVKPRYQRQLPLNNSVQNKIPKPKPVPVKPTIQKKPEPKPVAPKPVEKKVVIEKKAPPKETTPLKKKTKVKSNASGTEKTPQKKKEEPEKKPWKPLERVKSETPVPTSPAAN